MRLERIQLAGFKSFVDPTQVELRSNLTAIVGPNGCGKSNIVDAIRWVIGESSAKQLRGELLTDVIFNGTTQRKPVGQASIELLFDNSAANLGGAYAQYAQIIIRREIHRDGHTQFYLNGTRCRRRDITDVFLGTGLGPNSYAIIEQGVISKLIEGKPEEIRSYLEEAAGISRYRERRRETENRIRSTRENLERLTDIRLEMGKQLDHLNRQARSAERYKTLQAEHRILTIQLHTLHCARLEQERQTQQADIQRHTQALTQANEQQAAIEHSLQHNRSQQTALNQQINQLQAEYYEFGTELATTEKSLQHIEDMEQQLYKDAEQLKHAFALAEQQRDEDHAQHIALAQELTTLTTHTQEALATAAQAQADLHATEQQYHQWQTAWEAFQQATHQAEQQVRLEHNRLQQFAQQQQAITDKIRQLSDQQQRLDSAALLPSITTLQTQNTQLSEQLQQLQSQAQALQEQIQAQKRINQESQQQRDHARQALQTLLHRQASLDALQQAALGKANAGATQWLKQQGWDNRPRLLEYLHVDPGWEHAIETVLGSYLEAICSEDTADLTVAAESQVQGRLSVLCRQSDEQPATSSEHLADKVHCPFDLSDWLKGVYVAKDKETALTMRAQLGAGESVISRDGIFLGRHWLRISQLPDETSGVLQRQQELQQLQAQIATQQEQLQNLEKQVQAGQLTLHQAEEQRDQDQRAYREHATRHSQIQSQLAAQQAQLEHTRQREAALTQELTEQHEKLAHIQTQHQQAFTAHADASAILQKQTEERSAWLQAREQHQQNLQAVRQQARSQQQKADDHQVRLTSAQNRQQYLQQNVQRVEQQLKQLTERQQTLEHRRTELRIPQPALLEKRTQLQCQRQNYEDQLKTLQQTLQQQEHQLRDLEQQRTQEEKTLLRIRTELENVRVENSATEVQYQHHQDQISAIVVEVEGALSDHFLAEADILTCQTQLEKIAQKIQRLGAINLAAIEEHQQLLERKTYLDQQDQDLNEALATLESAIRKIDNESRQRLKATFEQANTQFQYLFHKMFEGGQASLELQGEELLQSGVVIRAQPPGKRNTLLHLLSGGEKALTAIALVFALFQLNPAPFCILDEVDAPLDEANVGRFCRLVQTMAEQVQFIYISHNKVAMEMAKQLVGVTMQEPGVSRLVAVDIDQALAMAASEQVPQ